LTRPRENAPPPQGASAPLGAIGGHAAPISKKNLTRPRENAPPQGASAPLGAIGGHAAPISKKTRMALAAAAGSTALLAPFVSAARADTISYYTPPKMLKQGTNKTPAAGNGKVVLKVLVNANGTFKVQSIISSTNHADDAAALEIAKSSVYAPATQGPKKVLAYYDYTLKFSGGTAQAPITSELAGYEAQLRNANYTAAQTGLKSYVASHPNDPKGQLDLGVADTYLNDYAGGAAAFDKAGTIPAAYHAVAAKSYVEYAVGLLDSKNFTDGLTAAKRAADFAPGFAGEDTLGFAQMESGDPTTAVTTLQKAHDSAKTEASIPVASRVANDLHLAQAYFANGDPDSAQKYGAEATGLDPKSASSVATLTATYDTSKAQDDSKTGKFADSAALYLQAAASDPADAKIFYVNAAFAYLKIVPTPDAAKAKDAADKALALDPNNAAANYAEGVALADQGKKSDATTALTKADTLAKSAGETDLATQIEARLKQLGGGGT
jgi:Flp pilus assembly protein TadD